MHSPRALFLAAVAGAWALLVGSVSSLLAGASWPDVSLGHIVEIATAVMASGFLYFVRRWITKQETADREVVDTLRKETAHQRDFEARVMEFMGLVKGHLGLHNEDSDPAIRSGHERRTHEERRIIRPGGNGDVKR